MSKTATAHENPGTATSASMETGSAQIYQRAASRRRKPRSHATDAGLGINKRIATIPSTDSKRTGTAGIKKRVKRAKKKT